VLQPGATLAHNPQPLVPPLRLTFRGSASWEPAFAERCYRRETMLSRRAPCTSLVRHGG